MRRTRAQGGPDRAGARRTALPPGRGAASVPFSSPIPAAAARADAAGAERHPTAEASHGAPLTAGQSLGPPVRQDGRVRPDFGLCDRCVHQFLVHTTRGSTFSRCDLHKVDPRFRKYPPVPVVRCPGFEDRGGAPARPS